MKTTEELRIEAIEKCNDRNRLKRLDKEIEELSKFQKTLKFMIAILVFLLIINVATFIASVQNKNQEVYECEVYSRFEDEYHTIDDVVGWKIRDRFWTNSKDYTRFEKENGVYIYIYERNVDFICISEEDSNE